MKTLLLIALVGLMGCASGSSVKYVTKDTSMKSQVSEFNKVRSGAYR